MCWFIYHSQLHVSCLELIFFVFTQMLNLDLLGNGDNPSPVKKESIHQALERLSGPQRVFIELCLRERKEDRPSATSLLKHPALQEVRLG